jgi:hypothetical protein
MMRKNVELPRNGRSGVSGRRAPSPRTHYPDLSPTSKGEPFRLSEPTAAPPRPKLSQPSTPPGAGLTGVRDSSHGGRTLRLVLEIDGHGHTVGFSGEAVTLRPTDQPSRRYLVMHLDGEPMCDCAAWRPGLGCIHADALVAARLMPPAEVFVPVNRAGSGRTC